MAMTWEKDLKPIFRPEDVHMGTMKVDPEQCNGCGLCIENCLFRSWEMGDDKIPRYKEGWACFSCYNCMVACPTGAVSVGVPYHVDSGFWKSYPRPLPPVWPLEPRDAEGKPDQWNEVEKLVLTRRTVRNFSDKPVPEPIIRRVLEAGRFAPTGGNSQPWQFIVITDKALIKQIDDVTATILDGLYKQYTDDEGVKALAAGYEANPNPGSWDPRIILGGIGKSMLNRVNPPGLGAPCMIVIAADTRAIGGPQMQIGICGQNMNLVANSLGIKATWAGFPCTAIRAVPSIGEKVGIKDPFVPLTTLVLGYPRFKQEGLVPREFRPIIWHREGAAGPEIEETPAVPEVKK